MTNLYFFSEILANAVEAAKTGEFGGKPRSELKDNQFLDPERRSFPIADCEDVSSAPHRFGSYKGSLSTEELKSRLIRRAKSMGCEGSLPKEWAASK